MPRPVRNRGLNGKTTLAVFDRLVLILTLFFYSARA